MFTMNILTKAEFHMGNAALAGAPVWDCCQPAEATGSPGVADIVEDGFE
jgi:hypothetical protein